MIIGTRKSQMCIRRVQTRSCSAERLTLRAHASDSYHQHASRKAGYTTTWQRQSKTPGSRYATCSYGNARGQDKAFTQDRFVRRMDIPDDEKERIISTLGGRKTPQLKGMSEPIVLAQKPREGTFVQNWMTYGVGLVDMSETLDGKCPGTIMNVPKPRGKERAESRHMTLKPIALMEHLVRLFTKPGDIVLDPFNGSGTTGIACENSGRLYVGIEIDGGFVAESKDRLERHVMLNGNAIEPDTETAARLHAVFRS
jgi:hypothetical protein